MKLFGAAVVIIFFLTVGQLSAQYYSVGGFGNVVFPGIGHAPAHGNPWGNVVSPAMPQGAAAASSPARGFIPGFRSNGFGNGAGNGSGNGHRRNSSVYVFPAFIGGYGNGYAPAQPDQPAPDNIGGQAPAQQPVIINQYFGQAAPEQTPANTDAVQGDSTYYLIAFKDHTIYSAIAYYTDGGTLHYFTAGNVHNQVSLSLVDRQLTEQLNRDRNVEVRFP